jgi:glycine/serine hydroxymethyltransferase
MKEKEMKSIGKMIVDIVKMLKPYKLPEDKNKRKDYIKNFEKEFEKNHKVKEIRQQVKKIALRFPIP